MSSKADDQPKKSTSPDEGTRSAETEISQTLSLELSTEAWDALGDCLERFGDAWKNETPPKICDFLPSRHGLRQVALVELIKLDMEQRYGGAAPPTTLEEYAGAYPELGGVEGLPAELIYEEFLVRKQTSQPVELEEYLRRFPRQAPELQALAAVHATPVSQPPRSTSITSLRRPDRLQVGDRIDDFDLLALLGQGSFAKVFLARQTSLQRLVALKISAARGFESQTLAQLDHPHIVRVYDHRQLPERNLQLLYMQYMPGGTLADVVQRVKRTPVGSRSSQILLDVVRERLQENGDAGADVVLPSAIRNAAWWKTVAWLGVNLCSALEHAHQRDVLHRDLKPANVLLGRDGHPRLADFNVSSSNVVASHISAAYFGGSLAYMSPEQLEAFGMPPEKREAMMDGRSDLFSLGILLWEVCTGSRPFRDEQICDLDADTLKTLAVRRRGGASEAEWKMLAAEAPPGFVEFFRKCLAANPDDRYESAAAAQRALLLCVDEAGLSFLQPRPDSHLAFWRKYPMTLLVVAALIPNVICSVLNIMFNFDVIIAHLTIQAQTALQLGPESAAALVQGAFNLSMMLINPIAYIGGVLVGYQIARPITRAASRAFRGLLDPPPSLRYRALWLPDIIAVLTAALWVLSGPAFPLVLHQRGVQLGGWDFLHFSASQAICGALASTTTFMITAPIVLRGILPSLLDTKEDDPHLHEGLRHLSQRSLFAVFISFSVILASAILWAYVESDAKLTFVIFMISGFLFTVVNFFYFKMQWIDPDIAALQATAMLEESLSGDTQSSLSTRPRRRSR